MQTYLIVTPEETATAARLRRPFILIFVEIVF